MINGARNLYNEYESVLLKNTDLSKENRNLKYFNALLKKQLETLELNKLKDKAIIEKQENDIMENIREIERLKSLLGIDGSNSGIPTSQTPINKKKIIPNTREKSDKNKGGQQGHPKYKLEKFKDEEVNEHIVHVSDTCPCCNSNKIKETGITIEKDETDFKIIIEKKRHEFLEYQCEECGNKFHENIPNHLKEENQYGPQTQTLALTLMNQGNMTINKTQKVIFGLTEGEINLSEGFIAKLQERASRKLEKFNEQLRLKILSQLRIHWDDTVIMINAARGCFRFYGTKELALYKAHLHKDKAGLDEDNILQLLPKTTVVIHDHNKVNYNEDYGFTNSECNRHLLGELKKTTDNLSEHEWARKLAKLLTSTNDKKNKLIADGKTEFSTGEIKEFTDEFDSIMIQAYKENKKDNNKYYSGDETTLITRIMDYKSEYTLWVYDFSVPFTNNLAERGLRGVKSKQKASGQFWSEKNAKWYANIKSYIETCHRNSVNVYNALIKVCIGQPYTLEEVLNKRIDP